jgi:hypothetical protein
LYGWCPPEGQSHPVLIERYKVIEEGFIVTAECTPVTVIIFQQYRNDRVWSTAFSLGQFSSCLFKNAFSNGKVLTLPFSNSLPFSADAPTQPK